MSLITIVFPFPKSSDIGGGAGLEVRSIGCSTRVVGAVGAGGAGGSSTVFSSSSSTAAFLSFASIFCFFLTWDKKCSSVLKSLKPHVSQRL